MAKANDEMDILGGGDDLDTAPTTEVPEPMGAEGDQAPEPTVPVKQTDLKSIQSALTQASAAISQYVPQEEEEADAELPEVEAPGEDEGEPAEETGGGADYNPQQFGANGGKRGPRKL